MEQFSEMAMYALGHVTSQGNIDQDAYISLEN